jgi:Bacterial Ig-like domain (group 3)
MPLSAGNPLGPCEIFVPIGAEAARIGIDSGGSPSQPPRGQLLRTALLLTVLAFSWTSARAQITVFGTLGSSQADTTNATSINITTTQAAPAGSSILIVAASRGFAPNTATCSDSAGHTYTTDVVLKGVGALTTICATHRIAAQLATGATITVTWPNVAVTHDQQALALAVTGLKSLALDRTASAFGSGTSASSGTTGTQTNFANELLVGGIRVDGTVSAAGLNPGTNGTSNNCATSGTPTYTALPGVGGSFNSLFGMYCIVSAQGLYVEQASLANPDPRNPPHWDVVLATYIGASPTSTGLTSSLNPSLLGQSVTFTATVTGAGGTPTGTVTFKDGSTTLGLGTLDGTGQATFSTSALSLGNHNITAVYGGDSNFNGSTSAVLPQQVNSPVITPAPPSWLLLGIAMLGLWGASRWRAGRTGERADC